MKDREIKLSHLLLCIITLTLFFTIYSFAVKDREDGMIGVLQDNWTLIYNGQWRGNIDFDNYRFKITNRGDRLVLSNTLPQNLPDDVAMRLHIIHCATKVYVDKELIYEFGTAPEERGRFIGYGTRFISLPTGSSGKKMMIEMTVTENNAFSSFSAPELYYRDSIFQSFYQKLAVPLGVSITLVIVGLCITIVTFLLFFKSVSMEKLFCIGVFSITIGCWSICSYNLDYLFTTSLLVKSYLEYFSLYILLLPLLLYFREDVVQRNRIWEKIVFSILICVNVLLLIVASVGQALNKIHLPEFVPTAQILMGLTALFLGYIIVCDMLDRRSHKVLVTGLVILLVLAVRDLVAFNVVKYFASTGSESDYESYVAIGALFFVVALLVDFINQMRKQSYINARKQFLEQIAYTDVLTNLYTRRKWEELLVQLDEKNAMYTIFQFDLNGLKYVNDTFGHEAGDKLIMRFSEILKSVFDSGELICRMGGDEFAVAVSEILDYNPAEKISRLDELVRQSNEEEKTTQISVSTGYARSVEYDSPVAAEVYKEADRRMYEAKEKYYKTSGLGRRKYD